MPLTKFVFLVLALALTSTNSTTENDSVPQRAEKARANKGQKAQDFGLTVN